MNKIVGALLSLCVFSVIGSIAVWLNSSERMNRVLKLCISVLILSLAFSFVSNFYSSDGDDFDISDGGYVVSDAEIERSASDAVCDVCKSVLSYICEDEVKIYYDDSSALVAVLSYVDADKKEQVKQTLESTVVSEVKVITE